MAQVSGGDKLDAALKDLADRILGAMEVRVGFLEGATYPDGDLNVPTVAAINNFGAPEAGIPARPFFSNMLAEESGGWGEVFAQALRESDMDTDLAMKRMGVIIGDALRNSIIKTDSPPLSPVTLLLRARFPQRADMTFADVQQARSDVATGDHLTKKGTVKKKDQGSTKPLDWTGHMKNSVEYEVNDVRYKLTEGGE